MNDMESIIVKVYILKKNLLKEQNVMNESRIQFLVAIT